MECSDWGERSPRWAGIRSQTAEVCGSSVHFLTADATWPGAPTHLLIHSTLGSATNWLDTIRPLTACGRVIAPDLPGTLPRPHRLAPPQRRARADQRPVPPGFHGHARAPGRRRARLVDGRPGGAAVRRPRTRARRRARARGPALPGPLSAAQELG